MTFSTKTEQKFTRVQIAQVQSHLYYMLKVLSMVRTNWLRRWRTDHGYRAALVTGVCRAIVISVLGLGPCSSVLHPLLWVHKASVVAFVSEF